MEYHDRRIISLIEDSELEQPELILKNTVGKTLMKLPLAIFREHGKQADDDEGDQLTNQSVGGILRAEQLAESDPGDRLPAVYGGLFTVNEYFFRSFDASKGNFFERVIASKDPNQVLDVDRTLKNLAQYLLEPHLSWKKQFYTDAALTDDEEDTLSALSGTTFDMRENFQDAKADATLVFEDQGTLVFGEHRSSVVTGGTTARDSLFRKPYAVIREVASNSATVDVPVEVQNDYDLDSSHYTFASFMDACGISDINMHIGVLFNENRRPAIWDDDPQQTTAKRLMGEFRDDIQGYVTDRPIQDLTFDRQNMTVEATIPVGNGNEIDFHFSWMYGDVYLSTLYTGVSEGAGQSGSLDDFARVYTLDEIIDDIGADDLWLAFTIAERENKVYELLDSGTNNAMMMADMILETPELESQLSDFEHTVATGSREEIENKLDEITVNFAEAFEESHGTGYVFDIYGGDEALQYLRDVAIMVVFYHLNSRPIFLQQFPESDQEADEVLPRARQTFEDYVYDVETSSGREDRMAIYRSVRALSRYGPAADLVPSSTDQSINWRQAPSKSDISDLLDKHSATTQLNIMSDGNDNYGGGIMKKQGDKYAVHPEVAKVVGRLHTSLPREANPDNVNGSLSMNLSDF